MNLRVTIDSVRQSLLNVLSAMSGEELGRPAESSVSDANRLS